MNEWAEANTTCYFMMQQILDKYAIKARLVPALLVLLPIGISLASIFPSKFAGWDLVVWLGTTTGFGVLLEQVARDMGRKKQSELFRKWGRAPSETMLHHSDDTFDQHTTERYHKKLGTALSIKIPTSVEELGRPENAKEIYRSCVNFLLSQTRDKAKYYLVFEENINFGFRRNLWGMKKVAISIIVICLSLIVARARGNILDSTPATYVAMIFNASLLIFWICYITPSWVKTSAEAFAKQLISSLDI